MEGMLNAAVWVLRVVLALAASFLPLPNTDAIAKRMDSTRTTRRSAGLLQRTDDPAP